MVDPNKFDVGAEVVVAVGAAEAAEDVCWEKRPPLLELAGRLKRVPVEAG